MKIKFSKYQGCGNDFIIIDNLDNSIRLTDKQIKNLCDRHFGIGADGLILVEKRNNNYFMNYFNSDGSLAEMCGNGMRCTARFLNNNYKTTSNLIINSLAGEYQVNISDLISVSLPREKYDYEKIGLNSPDLTRDIVLNDKPHQIDFVSMGNPHGVVIVKDLDNIDSGTAKELSTAPYLKNGANINFVQLMDNNNIKLKTYERGDGFTLACGTGACASAVVLNKKKMASKDVNVYSMGGCLNIKLQDNNILLSGNAEEIFKGEVEV